MRILEVFMSKAGKRLQGKTYPLLAGLAVFLAYPNLIAFQDVAAVSTGTVSQRWLAHMPEPAGNVILSAVVPNASAAVPGPAAGPALDRTATGSVAASAEEREISTNVKTGVEPQRINRAGKGDRVVSATIKRPPAYFSAGSVLQRQSLLEPHRADERFEPAFVEPLPADKAFEIAAAFHPPKSDLPPIEPDVPVMVASLITESAGNVLAYGEEETPERSPFAAVLKDQPPISLIPKLNEDDHAWAAEVLPASVYSEAQQNCLTAGIYFEARGEPVRGQAAVAQVILNRVRNPSYPGSICGVVYQNKKWRNRCQFSFACDGVKDRVRDNERWELARYVARETTEGRIWLKEVGSSTHYHATYVSPRWARAMKKVGTIGMHIFYRTFGGGLS